MPKYRMEMQEAGVRYTTYEVEAPTEEEAEILIGEDGSCMVSQHFEKRETDAITFRELSDE